MAGLCFILAAWDAALAYYMLAKLHMNDFGKLYHSAAFFLAGADMYGPSPATSLPNEELQGYQFLNLNPPHAHLPLLPLARLPAGVALAVWGGASLLALIAVLRVSLRESGLTLSFWERRLGLLFLLGFAGTAALMLTGQLSLLLLLPVTLAWVKARRGQWTAAGIYLGISISLKLFLLVFIPYLLVRRQLRAAITAVVAALSVFAIGIVMFGLHNYQAWLRALETVSWAWAGMNASLLGVLSRALSDNPFYSPLAVAPSLVRPLWLVGAAAIGLITLAISVADSSRRALDRAFALLLVGSLLCSPLGWVYYLWLPLGPLIGLAASWRRLGGTVSTVAQWSRHAALCLAVLALLWPLPLTTLFQPHAWASVLVGSACFWGTLSLWFALCMDWRCPT